jgi:putative ABC transport system permease protein
MKPRDVVSFSFSAIRLRKMRAGLTILGVVIGIAAIVALTSVTTGFQVSMETQLSEGFATDTVIVSTQSFTPGVLSEPSDFTLLVNDTDIINDIEGVQNSVAVMTKPSNIDFGSLQLPLSVTGVEFDAYASIFSSSFVVETGTIPTNPSNDSVIIGSRISDPWQNGTLIAEVGDTILICWTHRVGTEMVEDNFTASVVAILEEIGSFTSGPSDMGIYIPLSQARSFFDTDEVNAIAVQLVSDDEETIEVVSQAIEDAFDGLVSVSSPKSILETIGSVFDTIEILLVGIAGISLLVAGVGIMNIMIVSLLERTREIGILKALGMRSRTVLSIFLAEALLVGLVGGIFGVVAGYFMSFLFAGLGDSLPFGRGGTTSPMGALSITPVLTVEIILGAIFFGILVSAIFGLYPAWRASRLRPVDALRHD